MDLESKPLTEAEIIKRQQIKEGSMVVFILFLFFFYKRYQKIIEEMQHQLREVVDVNIETAKQLAINDALLTGTASGASFIR